MVTGCTSGCTAQLAAQYLEFLGMNRDGRHRKLQDRQALQKYVEGADEGFLRELEVTVVPRP